VAAVRAAYLHASAAQAGWAVPDGNTARNEAAAAGVAPRFTTIERAVINAFAEDHFNQIVDRTLSPGLAAQIRLPEAPRVDSELAPIARGLANAIDTAKGLPPGETLRKMAGRDRVGMAWAAAEQLVPNSPEKPFVVQRIADSIDKRFDERPQPVGDPLQYGQRTGQLAYKMAEIYGESPGRAQQDVVEAARAASVQPAREVVRLDRPTEAPASTYELMQRIQGAVGRLTDSPNSLWNDGYDAPPGDVPAISANGDLRISFDADLALAQLTRNADRYPILTALRNSSGDIRPEQFTAARDGIVEATAAYVQWAVPEGHQREAEARAEADPRFDVIASSVRDAFVHDNYDEIVDGVLPADLADRVKAAGPPPRAELPAAALGLAWSIDEAKGLDPGETLRNLAGQPRADIARTAAEALVPPAAVEDAAERINRAFEVLPAQVSAWRESGTPDAELADKLREYGHAGAREVYELGRGPEDALLDPHSRFASGDRALTTPRAEVPTSVSSGTSAGVEQPERREIGGR
jgi:hypothetical protein